MYFLMNGELSMKNKKSNTILIIQGVLFIILIIGAAYAYLGTFNINLNNNVAININSTSPGNLSFIANSTYKYLIPQWLSIMQIILLLQKKILVL